MSIRELEHKTDFSLVTDLDREATLSLIRETLSSKEYIRSGLVYGSSLLTWQETPDIDTAVMVDSFDGVVAREVYQDLKDTRKFLCQTTGCDIDLVTHTEDEINDESSPLFNARYYPSLKYGVSVKENFPIPDRPAFYQDAAKYVMHDNRTITRRQVLRVNGEGNWGIFLSKLHHGPGNAMTYLYNHGLVTTLGNPSDVPESFKAYDNFFGTDSSLVQDAIAQAKEKIKSHEFTFDNGVTLLNWYEKLFDKVTKY